MAYAKTKMYEPVIGLEVHLQLNTKTKAFCGCTAQFGKEPNTQVCPVCLGFPGSLPVYNKTALEHAIKVALALNCQIQEYVKFDRKNYFYPDLPKAYQISQFDLPLSRHGFIEIEVEKKLLRIGITRVHMEEDAGKLIHREDSSAVDYNRAGVPLLEIVSEPDMHSPEEAHSYLTALKGILSYLDVSDCDMEKGSLRCNANVSIRPCGTKTLGTKAELKNMNSFRAVREALHYEILRQTELVESNEKVIQETRLWDAKEEKTFSMRAKEEAKDYRYFPEPDLPPIIITSETIERIKKSIGELPAQILPRFITRYGLTEQEARFILLNKKDAAYAERCIKAYPNENKKMIVNWLIGPILSEANSRNQGISELKLGVEELLSLLSYLEKGLISNLSAKTVLAEILETHKHPKEIIEEKNLIQISDSHSLNEQIEAVLSANQKSVQDYKNGKENALMFLVGQVMRATQGKANPKVVQELLKERLTNA